MSDADKPTPRVVRGVMLNEREQKALFWLLHASDDGQVISGFKLPDVMVLRGIRSRLGRTRDATRC